MRGKSRLLKISTIDKLNDPFELMGVAFNDPDYHLRHVLMRDGLAGYMGLLCFSKSRKNPVQWSHYADRHRGLCLGFDVTSEVHKVNYTARRLKSDRDVLEAVTPEAEAYMHRLLTTKFHHWSYEEEYRLFCQLRDDNKDPHSGLHFYNFDEHLRLREVCVGPLSGVTRRQLSDAIGDLMDVATFKTRLAFKTFQVVKQKDERHWS